MGTWAEEIGEGIELGDKRLQARVVALLGVFAEKAGSSIPDACESWAATCAAYRFFDNEDVEPEKIIVGAARATLNRCRGEGVVLAVQDTTAVDYTSHDQTEGMGPLETSWRRGLFVHSTLAVSEKGVPLGLIAQEIWARDPQGIGKRHQRKQLPVEAKESAKWLVALKRTEERLMSVGVRVVTVADREADVYELFALAEEVRGEWVIRARHDRKLTDEAGKLLSAVESVSPSVRATVQVQRADNRPARQAKLEMRRATVVLRPPERAREVMAKWWAAHLEVEHLLPEELHPIRVGVILVTELEAPEGVEPLRWLLLTNLPVETEEQVLRCVGYYRQRWIVERYHYVLKSGCQVEKLQLETAERLRRALAMYGIVAWRLLWLTHEARAQPESPCTMVLDEDAWRLLVAYRNPKGVLPTQPPDLHTIVREIAKLGGFLGRKHDGEPGVKTIWRGLRRLNDMVLGYRIIQAHPELLSKQRPATYV